MKYIDREKFINLLEELNDSIVIVEGKNDLRALKRLGLKNIIPINSQPLIEVVHKVIIRVSKTKKETVILTDFDRKGKEIAAKLDFLLRKHKIHPNSRLRCSVMKLGWNKIEDLKCLTAGLRRVDVHVKVSTNFNKISHKGKNKGKRSDRKTRHNRSTVWSNRGTSWR